jgi:hypothetical protein
MGSRPSLCSYESSKAKGVEEMKYEYKVTLVFTVRAKNYKDVEEVGDPIYKRFADVPLKDGIVSKSCETLQTKGRRKK